MEILVLNGGSSSIKFSGYSMAQSAGAARAEAASQRVFAGELSGVGGAKATLHMKRDDEGEQQEHPVQAGSVEEAVGVVFAAISKGAAWMPGAVGHRVVHPGPNLRGHQKITPELMLQLEQAVEFAPLHDPEALELIRAAQKRFPDCAHYACFDTVFHETMPEEATMYPLPSCYGAQGVRRYGFHGLSCESIVRQMALEGAVPKRMVIAHLGSGCSVTAVRAGRSMDTTMGLTPTGGVVMGTRSGDLDPGLVLYLLRQEREQTAEAAADKVEKLLNRESGMVGMTAMANDMKSIRAAADGGDKQAALALRVFTRSIAKAIGAYCWLLGGLDCIVFAGGIGEHDAAARTEILAGLEELGVVLEPGHAPRRDGVQCISAARSKTKIFIVPAQEELMIALHVAAMTNAESWQVESL